MARARSTCPINVPDQESSPDLALTLVSYRDWARRTVGFQRRSSRQLGVKAHAMVIPDQFGQGNRSDTELVADGYDAVYAGATGSPTLSRIWKDHACGEGYPTEFGHISFLTIDEAARLVALSGLDEGALLVDLACGEGGPGLLIARDSGAELIGVDISAVGVANAAARAERVGLAGRAQFRTGAFEATGLDDSSADAVMTVDALQYSPDKGAALLEVARILKPGGRFVFTAFEVDPEAVRGYPVLGTDPVPDYPALIEGSGLAIEHYEETTGWRERLTATYQAVLDEQGALVAELGEKGYASLSLEVSLTLGLRPYRRRVLCAASRT